MDPAPHHPRSRSMNDRKQAAFAIFRGLAFWVNSRDRWHGKAAQQAPGHSGVTHSVLGSFLTSVQENEGVVPVNVLTWVLPSGATVGR